MQITQINGDNAHCVAKGIERDVSLLLLADEDIKLGDHALIHVGYALQKISAAEALSTWELLDQMSSEDDLRA
jgi:hydrogenase expression/formation protein HypC